MSTELAIRDDVYDTEFVDDDYDLFGADYDDGESMMALMNLLFGSGLSLGEGYSYENEGIKDEVRASGRGSRAFDWNKAAQRIKETGAQTAEAGLKEDWGMTGGLILKDGQPVPEEDTYTYLSSWWATPVLILDGVEEECWVEVATADPSNSEAYWPADALAIVGGDGGDTK